MEYSPLAHRQILDEDLQIIRVTLATINDEVRGFSSPAADAITEALERLDRAQLEFSHSPAPSSQANHVHQTDAAGSPFR